MAPFCRSIDFGDEGISILQNVAKYLPVNTVFTFKNAWIFGNSKNLATRTEILVQTVMENDI